MDVVEQKIGQDFDVKLTIAGGKIQITLEFAGIDAALDGIKTQLPDWAQPILDGLKKQIDAL